MQPRMREIGMDEPFNDLSNAELERLALLLEELGEAQQVIGKILRHGYPPPLTIEQLCLPRRSTVTGKCGPCNRKRHADCRHGEEAHTRPGKILICQCICRRSHQLKGTKATLPWHDT